MDDLSRNALNEPALRRDFIPPSDYSPHIRYLEAERLWPRVWQIACREEEIPNVGDFVNYEIGTESILVMRSAPDCIRAFYNVCAHRGRRLYEEPCGKVGAIHCRFHGWTYDLEGKPITIPEKQDWKDCPQFSDADISLSRVKVDTWAGFVWINMDPDCEPLYDFLSPLPEKMDVFDLDQCRIRSYQTIRIPANWKVVYEAFIEGYHINGTHTQLFKFGHITQPAMKETLEDPDARHGAHGRAIESSFDPDSEFTDARKLIEHFILDGYESLKAMFHEESVKAAKRLVAELPEGLTSDEVFVRFIGFMREEVEKMGAKWPERLSLADLDVQEWQIFPNSSALPTPEGGLWYRMRPCADDPDACLFDIWTLHRYAPGKEPKVVHEYYEKPEDFRGKNFIIEQDLSNFTAVHKGVRSRGWKGGRANPFQETNVYIFHRVFRQYLYGEVT